MPNNIEPGPMKTHYRRTASEQRLDCVPPGVSNIYSSYFHKAEMTARFTLAFFQTEVPISRPPTAVPPLADRSACPKVTALAFDRS